jgi:diguanylate cyclase
MLLQNTNRGELQQILTQLDQALYNHQQWHNDIIRTLVCRLPHDKHAIDSDAYKECRFGQWYYSDRSKNINHHPGFIAIGEAHQRMHQLAGHVLTSLEDNNSVTPLDYDNFANSIDRLRLEIYAFKNELENLLYNHDPLTMAINRISMLPILREQQQLSIHQSQPCCLAMVDIDFFKKVNDQYGHLVGDKVLVILARYFIEHLRSYDKLFRYGGEEFLICMQQVDLSKAFDIMDNMREEIAMMPFNVELPTPIHITVSCGISMLDPNINIEQAIDHADKALYTAKSSGRNQTQRWNPEMALNHL